MIAGAGMISWARAGVVSGSGVISGAGMISGARAGVPGLRLRNGGLRYIVAAMIIAVVIKTGIGLLVVSAVIVSGAELRVAAVVVETGMLAVSPLTIMARLEAALGRTFQRLHSVHNVADALVEAGFRRVCRG